MKVIETKIKTYGNSMVPFLMDGDVVYLKKVPFAEIKVDDIITFRRSNIYITHRVIYRNPPLSKKKFVITKGDSNFYPDKKISSSEYIGKVTQIKRGRATLNPQSLYIIQSSHYFSEIILIKKAFEKANIRFLFLKGLPLHLYFEKDFPKRFYADCDLLIDKKDYKKATRILKQVGYELFNHELSKTHTRLKDKHSEQSYSKIINNFRVIFDIHLEAAFLMTQLGSLEAIYPQNLIDEFSQKCLEEKILVNIQGQTFPLLSKENLIIYLALHLFHHNYKGYNRYYFLSYLLKKAKPNFVEITKTIDYFKLSNFIYPVFINLQKYYGVNFEKNFSAKIKANKRVVSFIKHENIHLNIFDSERRIDSGVKRFLYIFQLSPLPLYRKVLIFFNRQVAYSVFWVIQKKLLNRYLLQ